MAEISGKDERVLNLLVKQKLITPSQESRLRMWLKRGADISEAIQKTPLVDPVKLASLQSLADHTEREEAPLEPAVVSPATAETAADTPNDDTPSTDWDEKIRKTPQGSREAVKRIEDSRPQEPAPPRIFADDETHPPPFMSAHPTKPFHEARPRPSIDIDADFDRLQETEREFPPPSMSDNPDDEAGLETLSSIGKINPVSPADGEMMDEVDSILDEAFQKKQAQKRESRHGQAIEDYETIAPPGDRESYRRDDAPTVQTYDLTDDEGIPLIQQVNEVLARALARNAQAILIDPRLKHSNVKIYSNDYRLVGEETLHEDMVDKVLNRLKVMARIDPWRRHSPQKGSFKMVRGQRSANGCVRTGPLPDEQETIAVYIFPGYL